MPSALPPSSPPPSPCHCTALRRITRAVTAAYDEAIRPSGLRITQFMLLRALARIGPATVKALAAEVDLDRSTMGRNLDPLERRGLVQLAVGESDHRERVVRLTEAGREAIATAEPYWDRAQARMLAGREATDLQALVARLETARIAP